MMRYILALALVAMLAVPCFAKEEYGGRVETEKVTIFSAVTVNASGTSNSTDFRVSPHARGSISFFVAQTGSGSMKYELRVSDDGSTWYTPSGSILGSSISDDISATTASGNHCLVFDFPLVNGWGRVVATEVGGANNATFTGKIHIQ